MKIRFEFRTQDNVRRICTTTYHGYGHAALQTARGEALPVPIVWHSSVDRWGLVPPVPNSPPMQNLEFAALISLCAAPDIEITLEAPRQIQNHTSCTGPRE